ncbi:hypothetical protein CLAFUW4_06741 [Fulvia fulva]|uniref:Uncharacterized protein n=1 Tax=Passalora fulva TaxID=5499 RepID=A0A9Q8URB2_PASFU|nr:uncharacterized protein CLAFUR5_06878 [Fulvia fulva]KAK4621817.1 hypothetical protein CLAFUR4_06749 [Fulvia fulva]KAK4622656.1 hypothetical protein CLAFUR0_06744 [Fulvia fulva]UJO19541.1 hypothetical protein CLAFUR5_06878 [Fulvia fulva]WPV16408.1 hypothetical protein CLAFUW4_06741 [Fulvia fulva]WPV31128.1 hypothetical protein CLAFUW7_06740 [Fulvia fulva]
MSDTPNIDAYLSSRRSGRRGAIYDEPDINTFGVSSGSSSRRRSTQADPLDSSYSSSYMSSSSGRRGAVTDNTYSGGYDSGYSGGYSGGYSDESSRDQIFREMFDESSRGSSSRRETESSRYSSFDSEGEDPFGNRRSSRRSRQEDTIDAYDRARGYDIGAGAREPSVYDAPTYRSASEYARGSVADPPSYYSRGTSGTYDPPPRYSSYDSRSSSREPTQYPPSRSRDYYGGGSSSYGGGSSSRRSDGGDADYYIRKWRR